MIFNSILLDTNILVYAINTTSQYHSKCNAIRKKAISGELQSCITPQIISEFYAITTDPKRVEHPLTKEEAVGEIENYIRSENVIKILPRPDSFTRIIDLLKRYNVSRQQIFDLLLVATMLSNNIKRICTYNQNDFILFSEIEVISPDTLLS